MNVLSLFSGIGGFSLGLGRAGMRTVAFCEIEPYCQAVLRQHWPNIPVFPDVTKLNGSDIGAAVDVISGGFPCQDVSIAGKGLGLAGERSGLWKDFARIIGEVRPRYVILENVSALLYRGLGDVLGDLAQIGYDGEWRCIPASKTGLPHRRDRLWIVAYPRGSRLSGHIERPSILESAEAALPKFGHAAAGAWRSLDNVIDGLRSSDGLSVGAHRYRIKALGNTVCPQITEAIGRAIMKMEHPDEKKAIQDQTSASR